MTDTSAAEITAREAELAACGHNVVNLHPARVKYDLMTDSWTEILTTPMAERMAHLLDAVDFRDDTLHIASLLPFGHFIYVAQGRSAEAFFWRAAAKKDKKVIQNMLFPTSRQHLVMNRMTPVECALPHVFDADSRDRFRGNLDCGRLRDLIAEDADSIAFVYIEADNNASGGYAVSMANVREISQIVADHGIKLVLDATRLMENCVMIQRFEEGYAGMPLFGIVEQFCRHFDAMTCSLAKDFGITRGGVIAMNDERLYYRARDTVSFFGPGINATDKAMINVAMQEREFIENMARRRVDQVERLHAAVVKAGLPVVSPAAGHCVLFDVERYLEVARYNNPVTSFIAHMYVKSGVRGGMHVSGFNRENCKYYYVRFAIPLCTPDAMIDELIEPFIAALKSARNLPDMKKVSSIPGLTGQLNARYEPVDIDTRKVGDKVQARASARLM